MTMEQFAEKFGAQPSRESLTLLVGRVDDPADRVLVYFPEGDIGVKECKPFMSLMVDQSCTRGILIVGGRFSNLAKTVRSLARAFSPRCCARGGRRARARLPPPSPSAALAQMLSDVSPLVIEHFRQEEVIIDITEHELVPEHVVLSAEEKAALLTRYKLRETQLPRIQMGDPVARYYGMQRGQVVKIIRPSETAGRYVTYRIVV